MVDMDVAFISEPADEVNCFFGTEKTVARREHEAGDLREEFGAEDVKPREELSSSLHLTGEDLFETRAFGGLLMEELDGDFVWPVVGGVHGYGDGLLWRGVCGSWTFRGDV